MDATPKQEFMEQLRQRVGLQVADASKDAIILACYGSAISILENYLDRYLVADTYTEIFTHIAKNVVSLRGYPNIGVQDMVDSFGNPLLDYHLDDSAGLIHFDGRMVAHELQITYSCVPPSDGVILLAFLSVFDMFYAGLTKVGISASDAPIKSISNDGATITWDNAASGGSATGIHQESGLPAAVVGLLNGYRREFV